MKEDNLVELERSPIQNRNEQSTVSNPGFTDACGAPLISSQAFNTKDLKKLFPEKIRTPVDAILQNQPDICDSNDAFN